MFRLHSSQHQAMYKEIWKAIIYMYFTYGYEWLVDEISAWRLAHDLPKHVGYHFVIKLHS